MNRFSISDLEFFSGIKAHTIRVWEQRYNGLQPIRSEGNTRYYDDNQLRRLLNIVSLSANGHKPTKLCRMDDQQLFKLLEEQIKNDKSNKDFGIYISQLIVAGMAYDAAHFEELFAKCVAKFGLHETYTQVIYPMMQRIGLMWASNMVPPAQEHFITNIIRQKLFSAIDALPRPSLQKPSWVLFLPENELHDIGLLFACYIIRKQGHKVVYLGSNVPLTSVVDTAEDTSVQNLFFFLVHSNPTAVVEQYVQLLATNCKKQKIFIAGSGKLLDKVKLPKKVYWLKDIESLEKEL